MFSAGSGNRPSGFSGAGQHRAQPAGQQVPAPASGQSPERTAVHRIRLRPPWQSEATPGSVRWQRRFNRPSGLSPTQRVWIVVWAVAFPGTATLNGKALGALSGQADTPSAFDVTDLLQAHNRLELDLEAAGLAGVPKAAGPGQVWIEIRGQ